MDSPTSYVRTTLARTGQAPIEVHFELEVGLQRRAVAVSGPEARFASRFVEQVPDEGDLPLPTYDELAGSTFDEITEAEFYAAWSQAVQTAETVELFVAADPDDIVALDAIEWRAWPRINPGKPMFCPVPVEDHASRITRESQTAAFGVGYVLRFEIVKAFLDRFPRHRMTKRSHEEYWIAWSDLRDFNDHIVGTLVTVDEYRKAAQRPNLEGGRELMAMTRPKVRATKGLGAEIGATLSAIDSGGPAAPRRPAGLPEPPPKPTGDPLAEFGF